MKLVYNSCIVMLFAALLSISNSLAQEGQVIPFQGTLYQGGTAVNGTVNITFTIADPAWTETHNNVSVTQGVYAVVLGEATAFPDDLFTTGTTPDLVVNIGGNDVATVALHSPFISKAIVGQNMPGQIERTFDEDGTEFNGLTMVVDGVGDAQTSAFEGVAQSATQNTGVEGFAVSGNGNVDTQNGLYGQAAGDGTGNHRGVMGYGAGGGKYNHGVKGYAAGTGDGSTGYNFGEGSINFGVEGNAGGNAWNNTGVEGSNFGTEGVTNFGVHGISSAGSSDTVSNYGVSGNAFGVGRNYGVYGLAGNGTENWAGYFDGDVNVNGDLMVNGLPINTGGTGNSSGVFDSIQVQNSNDEVRAKLTSYENGGLDLYDRLGEKTFQLMSNDTTSHFFMYNDRIRSSNGNRYPGFWMKNYDWGTYFQMVGVPESDDPDWEKLGEAYIQTHGTGATFTLGAGNEGKVRARAGEDYGQLNIYSNEWKSSLQMGGKFWEGRSDLGYMAIYGSPDTLDMIMMQATSYDDGSPQEMGEITLFGTDGSSFTINAHGLGKSANGVFGTETNDYVNIGAKEWEGNNGDQRGFIHLSGTDDGLPNGDTQRIYLDVDDYGNGSFGVLGLKNYQDDGGGNGLTTISLNGENGDVYAEGNIASRGLEVNDPTGIGSTRLGMAGPNGDEAFVSLWKNGNELILLNTFDDGDERGHISVSSSTNGTSVDIDGNGNIRASQINLSRGANDYVGIGNKEWEGNGGDERGRVYLDGTDDFGNGDINRASIEVNNEGAGSYGYIGLRSYQDDGGGNPMETISINGENGDISANGNIWTPRTEIQSNWGNDGQGAMILRDANDNWRIQASVDDDGSSNYHGYMFISNSTDQSGIEMNGSGRIDFKNASDGGLNALEMGQGGDAGFININDASNSSSINMDGATGNLWTRKAEMISNWGNSGNQGAFLMRDNNDDQQVRFSVDDDGSGNYWGQLELSTNQGNDSRMNISSGGINMGNNAYDNGIVMNYDNSGGGVFEMYAGSSLQAFINGSNGDASFQGEVVANSFLINDPGDGVSMSRDSDAGDGDGIGGIVNVNGDGFVHISGVTGDIDISGSYNNTSDARFKKNVKSIDNALAKTQQLNGYTYNWNKLAKKQKGITNKEEQVGILAQELEAVFPQLVKTDDEGYKSVNYAALTAVLIEAVKELSEQVTNLQGENAELKAELTKVDELEIKIDLIQKLLAKQALTGNEATASR
ncbi:tail fiber domain-containing protein [Reichenbachiella sp.]|uniref:tail fiber domain-containing protein n=1 Tax=Reichenbachiella sp. TaxID=2184521 RepID=UPI003BAFEBEF